MVTRDATFLNFLMVSHGVAKKMRERCQRRPKSDPPSAVEKCPTPAVGQSRGRVRSAPTSLPLSR